MENFKEEFLQMAKIVCPGFVIDNANTKVIDELLKYFFQQPGELHPEKGLWIEGDLGTGKTTLMRIFSMLMLKYHKGFLLHPCPDVAVKFTEGASLDTYTYAVNSYPPHPVAMCFDDLGRELIPSCRFGSSLNVMQYILHTRYNIWQKQKIKTFITTNCDAEMTERLYGNFIRDRRKEMFNILVLPGRSRRK